MTTEAQQKLEQALAQAGIPSSIIFQLLRCLPVVVRDAHGNAIGIEADDGRLMVLCEHCDHGHGAEPGPEPDPVAELFERRQAEDRLVELLHFRASDPEARALQGLPPLTVPDPPPLPVMTEKVLAVVTAEADPPPPPPPGFLSRIRGLFGSADTPH